ncbi:diguanylate cyclase domain-containing protein [Pseudoalteromonas sp. T1lg65]|uniref:diguanylate cyclase domain-containing protein n=1 Tax=Pseudoalteromonas sp. T1lg65 TaxID=2077101 RepID=UPI003F7AC135
MQRFFLILVLFFTPASSAVVEINERFGHLNEFQLAYSFSEHENISQLLDADTQWQTHKALPLGLRTNDTAIWVRFPLRNTSSRDLSILVSVDNNLLDSVTAFHVVPDHPILKIGMGDTLPLLKRPIKNESLIIPLTLAAYGESMLYLRIKHHGVVYAPISIWQPNEYLKFKSKFNLLYGILAGFVLALMVTNLTLFTLSKQHFFLVGTAFVASVWLLNAHLYGFSYRYLYGQWLWLQQHGQGLLATLSTLLLLFISRQALKLSLSQSYARLLQLSVVCGLILSIVLPVNLVSITTLALCTLVSAILFYLVARHSQQYRGLGICIVLLQSLTISYQLVVELGIQPGKLLIQPGVYLLYLLQCTVISYLLARSYMAKRDNALMKQQQRLAHTQAEDALLKEKLKLQEQSQQLLENNIEERTFELQVTLRELEEKNRELEKLNTEDPLTKVKNRGYFDKRLQMEARRSRREQTCLSLIIFDIDHFKKINDTYGHLAGDHAICQFANLIKQHLRRPSDEIFRYGGEEFIILLPNTSSEGAYELAERIRIYTAEQTLSVGEQNIKFTASAGIYSAIVSDPNTPSIFTDNADKALYQAKQNGRDQVVVFNPEQEI